MDAGDVILTLNGDVVRTMDTFRDEIRRTKKLTFKIAALHSAPLEPEYQKKVSVLLCVCRVYGRVSKVIAGGLWIGVPGHCSADTPRNTCGS